MARKTINLTHCDTCGEEIPADQRTYCGIQWSSQKVDTPVAPDPNDTSKGDHCAECFVKHLHNYTKKLAKLHNINLEELE